MNISSTGNTGCEIIMIMTTRFTRNANAMCIQGGAGSDHILRLEMDDINGERRIGFHIDTPFGEAAFLIILAKERKKVNGKPVVTGINCRERPPDAPHMTIWTGAGGRLISAPTMCPSLQ